MSEFHFTTSWQITGSTKEEVSALLNKPETLPLWWPAVYLSIAKKNDEKGSFYSMHTKGWLPYTIKWSLREVEKDLPHQIELAAFGDLEGRGIWTFNQKDNHVEVVYDWKVKGNKPIFRYLSFLLKPIFSFNHHWAMKRGRKSIELELNRLRNNLSRSESPTPPLATWPHKNYYFKNLENATISD